MNHQIDPQGASRRWVARITRSYEADDRRHFRRFHGHGLVAEIGQKLVEVSDISITGASVAGLELSKGDVVRMKLIPRADNKMLINDSVTVRAEAQGSESGYTRLRFLDVGFGLARLVVRHVSACTGVQPFIFR
jgi:hypothetical protein